MDKLRKLEARRNEIDEYIRTHRDEFPFHIVYGRKSSHPMLNEHTALSWQIFKLQLAQEGYQGKSIISDIRDRKN